MAATIDSYDVDRAGFFNNAYCANWQGCETVVAAVASASIYVEEITISNETAQTLTVGAGESSSAVAAEVIGPIFMANNSNVKFDFTGRPIKIPTNTALTMDASSSTDATITVRGFVK